MNIEAMAAAMFAKLHDLANRPRNWATHPDGDNGQELGRDTFRQMAQAGVDGADPEAIAAAAAQTDVEQKAVAHAKAQAAASAAAAALDEAAKAHADAVAQQAKAAEAAEAVVDARARTDGLTAAEAADAQAAHAAEVARTDHAVADGRIVTPGLHATEPLPTAAYPYAGELNGDIIAAGKRARDANEPRTPPSTLSGADVTAWERGWDEVATPPAPTYP